VATSALVIEELSGTKRRLELRGQGLPLRGAEWPMENRLPTSWNPGNTEATQHVIGPTDPPSEWEGTWKTTGLIAEPCYYDGPEGMGIKVVYAHTLWELFERIARGGQLLRVTWTSAAGPRPGQTSNVPRRELKISRLGRVGMLTPRFDRLDDIGWKVKFVWVGRGELNPKTTETQGQNAIAALREAMVANTNAAGSVLHSNRVSRDLSQPLLGTLESIADAPLELMDSFAQAANNITGTAREIGDLVLKVKELPPALLGRALDVATNAVYVANQFVDQVSRKGPEAICTSNKVSTLARAAAYFGGAQTQAAYMAQVNAELAARLRRARAASAAQTTGQGIGGGDLLAVCLPRSGDTFLSISMRYYNEDLSGELARANGLPAYTLAPPERAPVIVPVRAALDRIRSA
jgi:hypothetical protein